MLDIKSVSSSNSEKSNLLDCYLLLKYFFNMAYVDSDHLNFSKRIKLTLQVHRGDLVCRARSGGGRGS